MTGMSDNLSSIIFVFLHSSIVYWFHDSSNVKHKVTTTDQNYFEESLIHSHAPYSVLVEWEPSLSEH